MNKFFLIFLSIFLLTACSANNKSKFWSKKNTEKVNTQNEILFDNKKNLIKNFNTNIRININENFDNNSFINNHTNNNGILNYKGNLKILNKSKISKIHQFDILFPQPLVTKEHLIYFNGKGSILKFDKNLKLIWKKNYYTKKEKKLMPSLNFGLQNDTLIVTDNLSNYYAINYSNGKLIWKFKHSSSFHSQIKVLYNNFYTIDFSNYVRSFSINDGQSKWSYESENTLIKSTKRFSFVIDNQKLIFLNSVGDINALDVKNGNLLWQTPTRNNSIKEDAFSTVYSDIIFDKDIVYFSNNKNEFFAINAQNGSLRWKQNINSVLKSTVLKDLIFSLSNEGYLIVIDKKNGNIIRVTNIFNNKKNNLKKNKLIGFIVSSDKVYLSLTNGKIVIVNINNGTLEKIFKADNSTILRPIVDNKKMYIISKNSIKQYN